MASINTLLQEKDMMGNGKITANMDLVFLLLLMEILMKAIGITISKLEREN